MKMPWSTDPEEALAWNRDFEHRYDTPKAFWIITHQDDPYGLYNFGVTAHSKRETLDYIDQVGDRIKADFPELLGSGKFEIELIQNPSLRPDDGRA